MRSDPLPSPRLQRLRRGTFGAAIRDERGQTLVLSVVFVTVLLGFAALTVDLGGWLHEKRQLQAGVDAAALAGAQELPDDSAARSLAASYADKNGLTSPTITVSQTSQSSDTVTVSAQRPSQGLFARVFGISSVTLHATAAAQFTPLDSWNAYGNLKGSSPFGVSITNDTLVCGLPCFEQPTQMQVGGVDAPGAFDILSLDNSSTAPSTIGDWLRNGYSSLMRLGSFLGIPGAKFNASTIQSALEASVGKTIVVPIVSEVSGGGSSVTYTVVGWVGFDVTDFALRGNTGYLYGSFRRLIRSDKEGNWGGQPPYSAAAVRLVK